MLGGVKATRLVVPALILSPCVIASGCRGKTKAPPPPLEVAVVPVVQKDVPVVAEWIGTLDGSVNADIRPKVEGYLLRQLYKEGQFVHAGDRLFQIDPRQFRAALEQAQGSVGQAEALLTKADKDVERFTPLAADKAISQQELDNALAAQRNAQAAVATAKAASDQAALNLGWTNITSPIEGIVGIAKSQVGDLVNTATIMTTVSTVDPIRVTFGISEREYLRFAERINRPNYATTIQGPFLQLILDNGSVYAQQGRAVMADREVDPRTGTMTVKGVFPNPHNILRPGQYARLRATLETRPGALLVPQRAVMELQGGYRVAVVGEGAKAEIRPVETGEKVGEDWVIEKGLRAGEAVIVTGLQYVKADTPVAAKPFVPERPPEASPAAAR
jgi:membrane fusion protein (multidrug efflux system)